MEELEAICAQIAPLLESEGGNKRLEDSWYENWILVTADGLIKDAANEEPNLKVRVEEAEILVAKIGQDKHEVTKEIAQRMYDRKCTISRLKGLNMQEVRIGNTLTRERDKMNTLQLNKLHFANKTQKAKPIKPCLSGQDIVKHKLNFRMVHGTNNLAEEKQLLKEIKVSQKKGVGPFSSLDKKDLSRPYTWWAGYFRYEPIAEDRLVKVLELEQRRQRDETIASANADAAVRTHATVTAFQFTFTEGKIWSYIGSQKALYDRIKMTGKEIDELKTLLVAARRKIKCAKRELKAIEKDVESLKKKLTLMNERKDEAHQCIFKLRKQHSDVV